MQKRKQFLRWVRDELRRQHGAETMPDFPSMKELRDAVKRYGIAPSDATTTSPAPEITRRKQIRTKLCLYPSCVEDHAAGSNYCELHRKERSVPPANRKPIITIKRRKSRLTRPGEEAKP